MRRFVIEAEGLPDLAGMMLTTIEALRDIGGSANIRELEERVSELEGLSEQEQAFQMSGSDSRSRFSYYLAWARTYLKRGGALENSARGVWALTETGLGIRELAQTIKIYQKVNQEEKDRARDRREARKTEKPVDDLPTATDLEPNADRIDRDWKTELLAVLLEMDPSAFERLAQRLLREAGFTKVEVRGKSGDGGIDGVGVLRVNLVSFQVFFQCKRWKGSVGSSEVRDFRGAMQGRADKGIIITTGTFTSQASEEATRDGATALDLIDGERLCELLKENSLGVTKRMVEQVTVQPSWFAGI